MGAATSARYAAVAGRLRLHGIDVYTYLVDILQRVAEHPANRVEELTPRRWKSLFADNPLRSPLHARRT